MKIIVKIFRSFLINTIGKDSWDSRNSIERFFYFLFPNLFFVLILIIALFPSLFIWLKNFEYNQVLIFTLCLWLFAMITQYGSTYILVSKLRGWPIVISNIIFDLLFITILFDIALNTGVFYKIKNLINTLVHNTLPTENSYFGLVMFVITILFILFYFLVFKLLSRMRYSFYELFPDIKIFFGNKNLGKILINFILLSLYIITFFAFVYYILYVILQFDGFSKNKINFLEFIFYSFNILYPSPISSIEPTSIITKLVTAIESLFSYLILVVFISLILSNYSEKLLRNNRKSKINRRYFKRRRRF